MKLVIGLAGYPLAGKETVSKKLGALLEADGITVSHNRFSDILRDTLDLWGIPHGRTQEQKLAQIMQRPGDGFPPGVLAHATKHRLMKDTSDVGILDGMRWDVDEIMVREFPDAGIKSLIIYITASDDTRYARMKSRNRTGEGEITREEFTKINLQPNEIYIPKIGENADITLTNNYDSITEFERDIETAYREKIKPLLT
jgi:dephospho-CoA kinase